MTSTDEVIAELVRQNVQISEHLNNVLDRLERLEMLVADQQAQRDRAATTWSLPPEVKQ